MTTVEVPHGSRSVVLRVAQVIAETTDASSLVFEVPEQAREKFAYRPGQFLTLRIPSDRTGSVARCYSLASSPFTDDRPKVTVKRTSDGYGSNWLCDNIKPGDQLEVLPPSGVFTPKDLDEDLLLCAAGSGITPVMSILKSALARGSGKIVLCYANRDADSVIFASELRELAEKNPQRLVVVHWLEALQGLPTVTALSELLRPYTSSSSGCRATAPTPRSSTHSPVTRSPIPPRPRSPRMTPRTRRPWRSSWTGRRTT
jgi:3-ketosteroid 9alpha-monooxygenase subunit B